MEQEILAASLSHAGVRDEDYLVTTYRGMHDQIAKGMPPRAAVRGDLRQGHGSLQGQGGPMHVTHPETGVMVTTGIVGSGLPIGVGLATSSDLRKGRPRHSGLLR
ncbi:thiamine pyrophosphate-dependent enzyme [Streptomyces sp. KL116D]|uniref:thiamine pyrophosphate-dependent enzyme n=1 Tax=Streptomyces sp. KL116D TaxID=3045152 RepID=UPI00355664B2